MSNQILEELEEKATKIIPFRARSVVVKDEKSLFSANEFLLVIKALKTRIFDTFNPIVEKAHKAHKEAVAQKNKFLEPLKKAESEVKRQIANYMEALQRIKEEEERKAKEEAERLAKLEEERNNIIHDLKVKGNEEAVEMLEKTAIPAPAPFVPKETPKLEDAQVRKIWKWRLLNFDHVPRKYLCLDTAKITGEIRQSKGKAVIPGIQIYQETIVAS